MVGTLRALPTLQSKTRGGFANLRRDQVVFVGRECIFREQLFAEQARFVARAEQALAGLSGEFKNWMLTEAARLSAAYAVILRDGFSEKANDELFRAAHDIKGDAATFGYPSAAAAADSLCRIIEHAPELDKVPAELITHHINAIQAIVNDHTKFDTVIVASELSRKLRGVADEYLVHVNRDRPEHLEAILAPSIVPGD